MSLLCSGLKGNKRKGKCMSLSTPASTGRQIARIFFRRECSLRLSQLNIFRKWLIVRFLVHVWTVGWWRSAAGHAPIVPRLSKIAHFTQTMHTLTKYTYEYCLINWPLDSKGSSNACSHFYTLRINSLYLGLGTFISIHWKMVRISYYLPVLWLVFLRLGVLDFRL